MSKTFGEKNWKEYIPIPVLEQHPEFNEFYVKAWEMAFDHIKNIPGMPQNPYMDEAFCETQVWIWDTCFMSFFCKYARDVFPGVETLNNFYETLHGGKRFPAVIPPENEPDWTRATPGVPYEIKINIADNPPLFAWAEYENALMSGDTEHLKELLYTNEYLQKHYEWIENLHEGSKCDIALCDVFMRAERYGYKWEGGASGMDNTPRGRIGKHALSERPNNPDMLWLDAICQQALSALMISRLFGIVGDKEAEGVWKDKYNAKKKIINDLYWDGADGFFYDIDCNTHEYYKVMTIASYWALTSEAASREQADLMVPLIEDDSIFGGFVPFVSLARNDSDYSSSGKYWRGGVWLPTAYATLKGMANYGFYKETQRAGEKLLKHMQKTYAEFTPHTIWEAYNPEKCEPATYEHANGAYVRKDFCGWSALGPISVYIEFVLGFHTANAFEKVLKWEKPNVFDGKVGIKNYRFGGIVTDIVAEGKECVVVSNDSYTLEICGKAYEISKGENKIKL